MTRTRRMLDRLSQVDPLTGEGLDTSPPASDTSQRQRSTRLRVAVGAGLATLLAVALLLAVAFNPDDESEGVVTAAIATAADQQPIEITKDQYAFRTEDWFQAAIPGDIADASPSQLEISGAGADPPARSGEREVWFSPRDRGEVKGEEAKTWTQCSAADWVLAVATDDYCWTDIGGPEGENYLFEAPLEIQRAIRQNAGPKQDAPTYWEFSPDIAELGTDPSKIDTAVTELGKQLEGRQGTLTDLGDYKDAIFWDPAVDVDEDAAYRLKAVADLLANPLAPPDVRAALFEYAGTIDGVESSDDATDPAGRSGSSISITSTPADQLPTIVSGLTSTIQDPLSQYEKGGYRLDLSGLTLRTEVIFDPDTSDLLSESTELVGADDPIFGPWLERKGAPQTIYSRTFEPVTVVDSTDNAPPSTS